MHARLGHDYFDSKHASFSTINLNFKIGLNLSTINSLDQRLTKRAYERIQWRTRTVFCTLGKTREGENCSTPPQALLFATFGSSLLAGLNESSNCLLE